MVVQNAKKIILRTFRRGTTAQSQALATCSQVWQQLFSAIRQFFAEIVTLPARNPRNSFSATAPMMDTLDGRSWAINQGSDVLSTTRIRPTFAMQVLRCAPELDVLVSNSSRSDQHQRDNLRKLHT